MLRDAERVVVIWGERIGREGEAAVTALLDVAVALGLAGKDGSGLLEIPELANARGLREAGCLPDAGPGLIEPAVASRDSSSSDAAAPANSAASATGMDTEQIRAALSRAS